MIKILVLLLSFILLINANNNSIGSVNSTVEVVNDTITLENERDLNFGSVYQGETVTISETGKCVDMQSDTNIGKIHIAGVSNTQSLKLTANVPTELTHTNGTTTLTLTIDSWWCQGPSNGPEQFSSAEKDVLGRSDSEDNNNVNFTGTIDIPLNQLTGLYTGTIDFTVEW